MKQCFELVGGAYQADHNSLWQMSCAQWLLASRFPFFGWRCEVHSRCAVRLVEVGLLLEPESETVF